MKFKDITDYKPEIVNVMKMTSPSAGENVKIYSVVGTDTVGFHDCYKGGQYGSISNRERAVKQSEIRNFIIKIMKTKPANTLIQISNSGVVHIKHDY